MRRLLPASLFAHLGRSAEATRLPTRIQRLVDAEEEKSERLITWVQLAVLAVFAGLYFVAPRPPDAQATMFEPVPLVLAPYAAFTLLRLVLTHRGFMPGWFLVLSMLVDVTMLWALIWTFHLDYDQPPGFSLKVPTFIYIFVFIAVRALRFDARFVLSMGAFAAVGWTGLVVYALAAGGPEMITRNFVEYLNGPYVLIGAEFDKVLTIAVVTGVLSLAVWRGRRTLLTAVREEAAGRDLRRFLSEGVAEAVTDAEDEVVPGQAEARDAAILMLDIRGFTRFSGTHSPDAVVGLLTSFHARAIPLVRAEGGVVDKFMGDGVMATFGAVTPSSSAARDALRALDAVMAEAARWSAQTGEGLVVNGAVTAGPVVFAALGHANRLEYTVIGEVVNLAAKLEKHNKVEGSRALTTADCHARAEAEGLVLATPVERLPARAVTGVDDPLDLVVIAR
jgi:adenylate cyclase